MFRPKKSFDFAALPALLVVMTASWAAAEEPFPFPAPPVRSKPVYLAPATLPALPPASTSRPAETPRPAAAGGIRRTQAEAAIATPRGGLMAPVRKSVVPDTSETDRRVERLKRQLEELNEMLSRPPVEPPVIERSIVTPGPQESTSPFEPEVPAAPHAHPQPASIPAPPPARVELHESAPAGTPHEEHPATPPVADEKKDRNSTSGLIKGLPVEAIDRVHVADNLFAAGEYLLANEIYLQVDRKAISADESGWVEFQLANCSRRAGRLDDAKKRYRRVVADPTLGWLQDMAKWRLDAIDEREQLVKEHARLEAAIKQYTEVPRAAAKP